MLRYDALDAQCARKSHFDMAALSDRGPPTEVIFQMALSDFQKKCHFPRGHRSEIHMALSDFQLVSSSELQKTGSKRDFKAGCVCPLVCGL
jgi:hypothetical protein